MIDPEEFAEYETWKERKLTASIDLSVTAYNAEMEATALAWEAGVKAAFAGVASKVSLADVLATNPYRSPGTKGERRRVVGLPATPSDGSA